MGSVFITGGSRGIVQHGQPLVIRDGGDVMQSLADETPLERIGRADEVADSILYLCSEKASFVTGQVLDVTGGF